MKSIQTIFFFLVATLGLIISCARPPDYPIEPVIEFLSVSSNFADQNSNTTFGDTVIATLSFTDGDGDIGNEDDEQTIFIRDLRDSSISNTAIQLPAVPEPGANNGISGEILFRILPTCCIYPPEFLQIPCTPSTSSFRQDTVVYEVYIVDRAGNESNRVQLEPIFVQCN